MLHPKKNNVLYCEQDVVFVFAKLQGGALRSGFICNDYPAGEHSVLSHPFNDDLGEHCSPLRGIRVQMNLQTTY